MKQVKDKYTHTTLEQMPEHKLFRALMSGLNDLGFDCEAFAAGLQYEHPTVQQRFFALLRTCILFIRDSDTDDITAGKMETINLLDRRGNISST